MQHNGIQRRFWPTSSMAMIVCCTTAVVEYALIIIGAATRGRVMKMTALSVLSSWSAFLEMRPLSPFLSTGRFPLPFVETGARGGASYTSNGSLQPCGPGRHDTYFHGSPHVYVHSSDSIPNWMLYSSHASWYDDFCCRHNTVCR